MLSFVMRPKLPHQLERFDSIGGFHPNPLTYECNYNSEIEIDTSSALAEPPFLFPPLRPLLPFQFPKRLDSEYECIDCEKQPKQKEECSEKESKWHRWGIRNGVGRTRVVKWEDEESRESYRPATLLPQHLKRAVATRRLSDPQINTRSPSPVHTLPFPLPDVARTDRETEFGTMRRSSRLRDFTNINPLAMNTLSRTTFRPQISAYPYLYDTTI